MARATLHAYPYRITEAREARKYNMKQLADLLEITKQAVSRYELGLSHPSSYIIEKMSTVLNFPISFFYKQRFADTSEGTVFFRTFKSSEAPERSMIQSKCNWAREAYDFLDRYVKLPPLNLPPIEYFLVKDTLSDDDVEEIASITRQHWGLGDGPIDNITYIMEKNGIIISGSQLESDKTDACSIVKNSIPVVFYNKNLRATCRIRFSLAHELGHILMHGHITKEELKTKATLDRVEAEANHFASAFLMPEETFSRDVRSLSLNFFLMLKEKWKVSVQAIIHRCKDLQLIDQDTYQMLWRQLSYKRWRKSEPLDDKITPEPPRLLRSAIEFLVQKGNIGKQQIISEFCWSLDDLSEIFGVNIDFFTEQPTFKAQFTLI